jgi:hypothetical protein
MENHPFNNIVDGFIKIVEDFRSKKIIQDKDLRDYTESNLHSWLQCALIKSAQQEGLLAIPETKLPFTEPIDPAKYAVYNKKRKRHFSKVDVAFYDDAKNLHGVSEIFTMDGAHGALPSRKLANWLTPRDLLPHLIQHAEPKPKFIILVTTLLKKSSCIPRKTGIEQIDSQLKKCRNYYKVFKPYWIEFKEEIQLENSLLIINEDGIERV